MLLIQQIANCKYMFIALDLETTGFNPNENKIIEFGAVKFDLSGKKETLRFFVNPGITLPQLITHITKITDEDLKNAAPFDQKTEEVKNFIKDLPIIGHNIQFDMNFLESNDVKISNPTYDTQQLASIIMPNMASYSLEILSQKLKLTHCEKHRALDDAIATMELFIKLIKEFENLDPELLKKFQDLSQKSKWDFKNVLATIGSRHIEKKTKNNPPKAGSPHKKTEINTDYQQILNQESPTLVEAIPPYTDLIKYLAEKSSPDTYIAIPYHLFRHIHNEIPDTVAKIDSPANYVSLQRLEEFSQKQYFENHELIALFKYIIWKEQTQTGLLSEVALFHEEHDTISKVNIDENITNPEKEFFFKKALEQDKSSPALCTHQYIIENPPQNKNLIIIDFENFIRSLHKNLSIYLKLEPIISLLKSLQELHPENQTIQTLITKTTILFGLLGIIFEKFNDQNIFAARSTVNETILQTREWTESQKSLINLIEISQELVEIKNEKTLGYLSQWKTALKGLHEILQTPNINTHLVWLEKDQNANIVLRKMPYSFKPELQNILNKNKNYQIIDETLDLEDEGKFIKKFSGLTENASVQKLTKKTENLQIFITKDTDGSDKNKIPNFLIDYYQKISKKIAIIFSAKRDLEFMTLKLSQANMPVLPQLAGSLGKIQEHFLNEKTDNELPILLVTPYIWDNFEYQNEFDTVFIYKIPFEPPSDPHLVALSQNYENAFMELQVPRAIIQTKKIINRLVTNDSNNKKIVILDTRLTAKDYGKSFIQNLNGIAQTTIIKLHQL